MLALEEGVGRTAGAHQAGADGGDDDAVPVQFGAQAVRVAGEGELAGAVGEQVRDADLATDRADVDDAAAAASAHARQHGLDHIVSTPEVDRHRLLEIVARHHVERADGDRAGVVDQQIDRPEVDLDGADAVLDLLRVGDVAGDGERPAAVLRQVLGGALERVLVAGADRHPRAAAGELPRQHEAEAARAAGDEGDFVAEVVLGAAQRTAEQPASQSGRGGNEQRVHARSPLKTDDRRTPSERANR
jgi:hypothetical protein